jgi:hypothetical protein
VGTTWAAAISTTLALAVVRLAFDLFEVHYLLTKANRRVPPGAHHTEPTFRSCGTYHQPGVTLVEIHPFPPAIALLCASPMTLIIRVCAQRDHTMFVFYRALIGSIIDFVEEEGLCDR